MPVMVKDLRTIGMYLIIILGIVRFAFVPLHTSVNAKREILNEHLFTYKNLSYSLEKKASVVETDAPSEDEKKLVQLVKPLTTPIPALQAETLKLFIKKAERAGLTVMNFELPEIIPGKNISEVPFLIRLKGMPKALIETLKEIKNLEAPLDVKSLEIAKSQDEFVFIITLVTYVRDR